ncbi:hypothetical protein HY250_03605 [Candidatus Azambacteria bacterium]|nr:hypothetical protein [Candidatus Azambacteria bacterium]MBI3685462.1 hypothetical protein [Candidatus Azambacteria bacterium]
MRKIVIAFSCIALFAVAVFYFSGVLISKSGAFHYYQVPEVKISSIKLEVVYFVPRDQTPDPYFYGTLRSALVAIQSFHSREFNGLSALRYALYPKAVIGDEPSSFYDGVDTSRGNPGAMTRIFKETATRIYVKNGELYDEQFVRRKKDELPVRAFIYQGVGGSSGVLSAIMSYDYFTRTDYGATVLYHEVLHNLGVPDAYDYDTGAPQSDDIMGSGRMKPIAGSYIRDEIKKRMME